MPNDAIRGNCAVVSNVPAGNTALPWAISSPALRILLPFLIGCVNIIPCSVCSVDSCITTVSTPWGIGAPVIIRIQQPALSSPSIGLPAKDLPATGNGVLPSQSAKHKPYPSIAELSNGGTLIGEIRSVAIIR